MKSAVFSRGTTLQLPNTQRMLYPPQHNPVLQCVCVCECLSPDHHGILQGRVCARWLISTEDTLLLLFFLSSLCFSTPPLHASYECILFTILSLRWFPPGFLLHYCLDIHYTSSPSTIIQGAILPKCTVETPEKSSSLLGMLLGDQGVLDPWMNGGPLP